MFLVLFTVLCVIGALFVLPAIIMVAFLLFKKNNLIYGNFSNGDFRTILNKMINDMYGGAYGAGTARKTTETLSKYEALEILGLSAGATPEQITSAYHRLMKFAHPDKGGSAYFAQKLNQARDTLLGDK
ncbi:molecular chaperone DnaJ [Anaplasma ovis str. Haibei]|uniref:Molecular chaperone DnaJ n=1 Tax=Anaplasma ovis str. Haibei TaxID=1248439 RepID=A0A2Z2L8N9_9RICK|nr:DnaJ domain-containing protein [Anaplasma ovis]ASI48016.1 molecular chaperone DnaJ [Anaplasma ovis str. Haibei]